MLKRMWDLTSSLKHEGKNETSNRLPMTAHRRGPFVGSFGSSLMLSTYRGHGYGLKAPIYMHHLLSQINERAGAGFVAINEKLILKTADPLITFPKCVRSHLLLMYWPSVIDLPVPIVILAPKPTLSKADFYCSKFESQKLFGLKWHMRVFLNQHQHYRLPPFSMKWSSH